MTWIATIAPEEAEGKLGQLYARIAGAAGQVDNILQAHSLRPQTLEGHMALYKAVLHHHANRVEPWLLETVGVAVSVANGCAYCVEHHTHGLARLLEDEQRAREIRDALEARRPQATLSQRALAAVTYALKLTRTPDKIGQSDIASLRAAGFEDGEILEINQVTAYFAYANRTVLGLGVTPDGEDLGLAPRAKEDPADWAHK